jgi:hypothetical protein
MAALAWRQLRRSSALCTLCGSLETSCFVCNHSHAQQPVPSNWFPDCHASEESDYFWLGVVTAARHKESRRQLSLEFVFVLAGLVPRYDLELSLLIQRIALGSIIANQLCNKGFVVRYSAPAWALSCSCSNATHLCEYTSYSKIG